MNQPYVKQYNENGECINPINTGYRWQSPYPNRRARQETRPRMWGGSKGQSPLFGCGKNHPISLNGSLKYKRVRQYEKDKEGNKKVIEHYILQP